MKNIFESFAEKQTKITEAKTLSPQNTNKYNWNKKSVKDLKNWSYKLKDVEVKFNTMDYWGPETSFIDWLSGQRESIYDSLSLTVGGKGYQLDIRVEKDEFKTEALETYDAFYFFISNTTFNKFIGGEEDKIKGFVNLLDHLFKTYEKDLYKILNEKVNEKVNLETLYVIKAGEISPATGKTQHGWSIYDNPNNYIAITDKGRMVLYIANNMKPGDRFNIVDDQRRTVISNDVKIKELVKCTYKDFVDASRRYGAKIPVKAYSKQPGNFNFVLYSIK